jgi:nucleoside-diphosphate-sugar epimerase
MSLSGEKVMITGATGFLGNVLARRLLNEEIQIRILARTPEKAQRLLELGAEVIQGDINNSVAAKRAAEGCTCVFHLAAATTGNLDLQRQANVEGTRSIIQAAIDANVQRVVHVSSIGAYGYRYTADVTEDMPLLPAADPYVNTKQQAEAIVRDLAAKHGMVYSIIRPGMIYGARSGLWTGQLFRLAKFKPTPFIGSGSGNAHPIYVDDVVEMMIILATHPAAANETFNCSADPAPTWREFLQGYARLAGHQRWLALPESLFRAFAWFAKRVSSSDSVSHDLPDMLNLLLSSTTYKMTKARELLSWSPTVSLSEGIERCAPWLREKGWLR